MWCGVQLLAGNVLRRSAAARECDGECGAVFSGWLGIVARRPATGRECGRETGAAFSGWPGMWREMRCSVQRLAGNVAGNAARRPPAGRECQQDCHRLLIVGCRSAQTRENIISATGSRSSINYKACGSLTRTPPCSMGGKGRHHLVSIHKGWHLQRPLH